MVTIEGLSAHGSNPLQELLCHYSGTQCGFCTPGFVVSLTGFLLNSPSLSFADASAAIDGNICRCTGYKAIERAIQQLIATYAPRLLAAPSRIAALVSEGFLPDYFLQVPHKLPSYQAAAHRSPAHPSPLIGGGSDLFVQRPGELRPQELKLLHPGKETRQIAVEPSQVIIPASSSIHDFCEHPQLKKLLPCLDKVKKLFASTQIRQQATIAGNIINASPIGDIANFLLALDTTLLLRSTAGDRLVAQKELYLGYKTLSLRPEELLFELRFALPTPRTRVSFEKVSRRTHLDIASVTSTMVLTLEGATIVAAAISAGGVAPFPLRLSHLESWLVGRAASPQTAREAANRVTEEIKPISDVRGSAAYKTLLLSQMILAHFLSCCPETISEESLLV